MRLPPGYDIKGDKDVFYLEAEGGNVQWDPFETREAAEKAAWEDYESIHGGVTRPGWELKPFSTWLKETMNEDVENIPQLAKEWGRSLAKAMDYLVKSWWEYVETSYLSSTAATAGRLGCEFWTEEKDAEDQP